MSVDFSKITSCSPIAHAFMKHNNLDRSKNNGLKTKLPDQSKKGAYVKLVAIWLKENMLSPPASENVNTKMKGAIITTSDDVAGHKRNDNHDTFAGRCELFVLCSRGRGSARDFDIATEILKQTLSKYGMGNSLLTTDQELKNRQLPKEMIFWGSDATEPVSRVFKAKLECTSGC